MRRQMHRGMVAALLSGFVWPGAGQLYNREFRKAALLIGLTLLLAAAVMIATTVELARRLPTDIENADPDLVRDLPAQVLAARPGTLLAPSFLLLGAWGYGIVDAYLGGRGRRKLAPRPASEARPPQAPPPPAP